MIKFVILFVFLVSCQTDNSKVITIPASHIGEWETNCYSNQGNSTYGKINLIITLSSIELTTAVFTDSNCSVLVGEYYMKSDSYQRSINTYDTTLNNYVFTPRTPDWASALNSFNYCSLSSWSNGVTQSIFGRTCVGTVPELINSEDSFAIDVFRTDDTLETDYTTEIFYKID